MFLVIVKHRLLFVPVILPSKIHKLSAAVICGLCVCVHEDLVYMCVSSCVCRCACSCICMGVGPEVFLDHSLSFEAGSLAEPRTCQFQLVYVASLLQCFRVSTAVAKHHGQKHLERRGFISGYIL